MNKPGSHLISVDEKPSIQALQRKSTPMKCGSPHRRSFEYKRNGKTCLMAALHVGTGQVDNRHLVNKNDTQHFLEFIKTTVIKYDPQDRITFILDNLRTHLTPDLVKWIAKQNGYEDDLGKNRRYGILKNLESRRAFLSDPTHRIRFIYTPIHCSWLNPIENWFSKLQRQVINRGNFDSVDMLKHKIEAYVDYYNNYSFSKINWKFLGFTKNHPIAF
jgi:transposase